MCFPFVLPVWPSTALTEGFPRGVIFTRRTVALRNRLHVSHEQGLAPGQFVFPHPGTGISTHGCFGQGFYLQANVVQSYGSLITRYHVAVALSESRDISSNYSSSLETSTWQSLAWFCSLSCPSICSSYVSATPKPTVFGDICTPSGKPQLSPTFGSSRRSSTSWARQ